MKKEKAIIEYLEENDRRVCIYSTYGNVLEVCVDKQAFKSYDIIGEMVSGEIRKFGEEDSEDQESYDEYLDESVEED